MLDADIAKDVLLDEGTGPREREPDDVVFEREVLVWLKQWTSEQNDLTEQKSACVFLFHPEKPSNDILKNAIRLRCFNQSKPNTLAGFAYGCATGLKSVYSQELPASLTELPSVLSWLETSNLNDCFAVIFLPDRRRAFIKPLKLSEDYDELPFVDFSPPGMLENFDFSKLDTLLELFYKYGVETHTGACRIWIDPDKRELCQYPEDMVHRVLYLFLFARIDLSNAGVTRIEIHNLRGREDIEIQRFDGTKYEIGIVELKVLFPNRTEDANLEWALKGIQQVIDYASGRENVVSKYTVCYDGRKNDIAMPAFFAKATEKQVEGRRYFMETPTVKRVVDGFKQ